MLQKNQLLYQTQVTSPAQAMFHLFLHCCYKDGDCDDKEMRKVYATMRIWYCIHSEWITAQTIVYHSYAPLISNDVPYLKFLLHLIKPSKPIVLLWHCAQIAASNDLICYSEELLLDKLSFQLAVSSEVGKTLLYLALQVRRLEQIEASP
jgi:hypothetical protein